MKTDSGRIRLTGVEINSAGPISSFHAELAPLTLVYAPNERGKTTIVENLIACLFRQRKDGLHRLVRQDFVGAARVTVQGLGKKALVFTSLANKKKIDDLLEDSGWTFPPSLFDLLVVKGAELEILQQQGGLSRGYLKSLVSRERLFETLRDRLPSEVGYTAFENGVLVPKRRIGSVKTYEETQTRSDSLEKVADRFYSSLSRAELMHSLSRKAALEEEKKKLQLAKRHAAYLVDRSIQDFEEELASFDEDRADSFSETVKEYARLKSELVEQDEQSLTREGIVADLHWLEQARKRYEYCLGSRANPLQVLSFLAAGISLAGTLGVYFFRPGLLPVLLAVTVLTFGFALLFTFVLRKGGSPDSARSEMKDIANAFNHRFGTPLHTLADFDVAKSRLDRELGKAQAVEEKRISAQGALDERAEQIRGLLSATSEAELPDTQWYNLAQELKKRTRNLRNGLNRYQERLGNLGIEEIDYLEQAPDAEYSRQREEEINLEIAKIEAKIREEQEGSQELREQLIEHIGREAARSPNIENLAESIEDKRQEYRKQVRNTLAEMIAGHVVADILEGFRSLEDSQLESTLNDPRIAGLVKQLTEGRYERVSLEGEELFIENEAESYALSKMSSGVREQVLLALRMGLASIICGQNSLFLILDDAFQYSDWRRREALVMQAVKAVESGWQVLYLTMDDDIRDRFRGAAEVLDEGMFRQIEL